jgi:hypothetical protein
MSITPSSSSYQRDRQFRGHGQEHVDPKWEPKEQGNALDASGDDTAVAPDETTQPGAGLQPGSGVGGSHWGCPPRERIRRSRLAVPAGHRNRPEPPARLAQALKEPGRLQTARSSGGTAQTAQEGPLRGCCRLPPRLSGGRYRGVDRQGDHGPPTWGAGGHNCRSKLPFNSELRTRLEHTGKTGDPAQEH